jgi:hypothetical protein
METLEGIDGEGQHILSKDQLWQCGKILCKFVWDVPVSC